VTGPWIDLLVGCGGWSIPLLLLSYAVVDRDVPRWSAVFYALALVCNYPHYMATIHRAYGREDRGRHRLYTHYLTAALVAVGVAAHARFALVPWLFTTYVMWSPWHYTGQNFGLSMMFLRRAGLDVSSAERRGLRAAYIASYVMLLAAFNQGPSHDPLILSLALGTGAARAIEIATAVVFLIAGAWALLPLARRMPGRSFAAPLTLYSTQALWFVAPIVLAWMSALEVPQTRYSSGMLALMHSAQYLWITRYFARRDAESRAQAGEWSARSYWATLVLGGAALFVPIPWIASYTWHADFTISVFIVASVVNIHHFMIDGVVWKLRNPRVKQLLVARESGQAPEATPAAPRAIRGGAWQGTAWRAAAVVALAALAAVDQWRYVLAVGRSDPHTIAQATRLNPFDSGANLRLARAATQAGDIAAAEAALRRAVAASPQNPVPAQRLVRLLIEAKRYSDAYTACRTLLAQWPHDVNMLVNAGVLAYRLGDRHAAATWWRAALDEDHAQPRVHLYIAELADGLGDAPRAGAHYRAYLELVAASAPDARPAPGEVVPAVVRFGDALARQGERKAAITQYELAGRMARQTGLSDLEAVARERRAALTPR
jgi:tetratricopeptide (TPR) repeat protein